MRHEHGSISESERTALSPARQRDATGRQAVATKRALSSADGEPLATASAPVASVCAAKREACAQDDFRVRRLRIGTRSFAHGGAEAGCIRNDSSRRRCGDSDTAALLLRSSAPGGSDAPTTEWIA